MTKEGRKLKAAFMYLFIICTGINRIYSTGGKITKNSGFWCIILQMLMSLESGELTTRKIKNSISMTNYSVLEIRSAGEEPHNFENQNGIENYSINNIW